MKNNWYFTIIPIAITFFIIGRATAPQGYIPNEEIKLQALTAFDQRTIDTRKEYEYHKWVDSLRNDYRIKTIGVKAFLIEDSLKTDKKLRIMRAVNEAELRVIARTKGNVPVIIQK